MKKLLLPLILVALSISCSNDDSDNCQSNKDAINAKYDKQVQQVKDNPDPSGINYKQIGLLNDERNKKLSEACN